MSALMQELNARRAFGDEVAAYFTRTNQHKNFAEFRESRNKASEPNTAAGADVLTP